MEHLYQTYDGAFAALACLRSVLQDMKRLLNNGNIVLAAHKSVEVKYWTEQFHIRRESARKTRRA